MGDYVYSRRRRLTRKCVECGQFRECAMIDIKRGQLDFTCAKCQKAAEDAPIQPDYFAHLGTEI